MWQWALGENREKSEQTLLLPPSFLPLTFAEVLTRQHEYARKQGHSSKKATSATAPHPREGLL